jgi:hypothetical protein
VTIGNDHTIDFDLTNDFQFPGRLDLACSNVREDSACHFEMHGYFLSINITDHFGISKSETPT